MKTPLPIDAIYAWVATETDGSEGICSGDFEIPGIGKRHMPLIGADRDRIESLRPIAEYVHRATGCPVRMVRFTLREDLESL
jgi:hypothetical protein